MAFASKQSLIDWAASWVHDQPEGQRARFVEALTGELQDWRPPEPKPEFCKNCPFAKHVHWEENGKLVSNGCGGFEPLEP
jgi:hypothetical protein